MTDESKEQLLRDVTALEAHSRVARQRFEEAIRAAARKATVREVAEAAQLGRSRTHQIIQAGPTAAR